MIKSDKESEIMFKDKLKELRKNNGLTQEELAKEFFVSRTLISKYESGAIYPTKENAEKLAKFFNVNLSDLIDNDETVGIVLKNASVSSKSNKILSIIIINVLILIEILFFLPVVRHIYYDYSHGTPPIMFYKYGIPIIDTLRFGNPTVLINFITILGNIVLSFFTLKYKDNFKLKIINYVLFGLNIIFAFFSIVTAFATLNSRVY